MNGSPAPMPGAPLALRVLVISPKLVELDMTEPGFAQLVVFNRLKISKRSWSEVPALSFVVLKSDRSMVLNPGPYSALRARVP